MARGDLTVFNEAKQNMFNNGLHFGDTWKVMLITTLPTAAALTPDSSDFTEVSGTNYTAGGEAVTASWNESAGTVTFDLTDVSWTQHASGPTNIKAALIYSTTATSEDALAFVDMTADSGTTAISLVDGNISIAWAGTGVFTLQ